MGQYRQWLSYREADQQFQNQIKESEKELVQLYAQIDQLESDTTDSENIILQMLIGMQQAEKANRQRTEAHASNPALHLAQEQSTSGSKRGSVSPALFGWGNLPNFSAQGIDNPITDTANQRLAAQFQPANDNLLPHDLNAFTHDSSQTDPQIKIPWWLRDTPAEAKEDPQSTQPIDQLSQRTNQYVQRWFERWGKSANESEQAQEKPRQ